MSASDSGPVEAKVKAASIASLIASFVVGLIVIQVPALSGLGPVLQSVIVGVITTAATGFAGWLADHTPRPDLGDPTV